MDLTQLRAVIAIDDGDFAAKMAQVSSTSKDTAEAVAKLTEAVTELGEKMSESGHHAETVAAEVEKGFEFGTGLELARKGFEMLSDAIKEAGEATLGFVGQNQQWSIIFDKITQSDAGAAMVDQAREAAAAWGLVPEQVFAATKSLEAFGLAGEANLTLMADAAAGSGNSLDMVAQRIGLVYANMQEGLPISRYALQLERANVLTAETVGKLKEMEKAHGDVGEAWKLITDDLAKFNGAAAEMGNTFPNAAQRVKNEIEDLIGKAFTPLGEAATGAMDKLGAALNSPAVQNALIQVEAYMQVGIDTIRTIWDEGIAPIVAVAASWGEALLNTFAQGMTAGLNAVVSVVNALTDILTFWFKPGSPPRFLPYLDQWGTAAMDTYMQGWTKIDTGVFGDLSKLVEEELRTAFGQSGGAGLFDAIMGDRTAILDAFNEIAERGTITAETMERIRDASGPIADEVLAQVEAYGQLADITDRLNESTRTLTGLKNAEKEALAAPNAQLDLLRLQAEQLKINADLAKGPNKGESAEAFQNRVAQLRIEKEINEIKLGAQPQIDAEQQINDKLKDQKGYQEDLVASMKSMADWQKENVKLWDEFHKAAAGGGGGGGAKGPGFSGALPPEVQQSIDDATKAKDKLKEAWKQITEGPNAEILKADWDKVLPILKNIPDEINKLMDPSRWPELEHDFGILATNISAWIDKIAQDPTIIANVKHIGETITSTLITFVKETQKLDEMMNEVIAKLTIWVATHAKEIDDFGNALAKALAEGIVAGVKDQMKEGFWDFLINLLPGMNIVHVAEDIGKNIGHAVVGGIKSAIGSAPETPSPNQPQTAPSLDGPVFGGGSDEPIVPFVTPLPGRASGGPIDPYTPYLVHQDEIIFSSVPGYVVPPDVGRAMQTANVVSGAGVFGNGIQSFRDTKIGGGQNLQLGDIHVHVNAGADGKISIPDFANAVADFGQQVTAMASKALDPHLDYITEGVLDRFAKLAAG